MIDSPSKRQDVDKASKKIAKVVQTFAEFRFQIFGARNLAVASIENTEHLKYRCSQEDTKIIAALKKYAGDERQNENGHCERGGMNRKLNEQTCYAARNRPIQKSRNETILWFTHLLGSS
jgi:hypothetical protein